MMLPSGKVRSLPVSVLYSPRTVNLEVSALPVDLR
jgi:hypothetical protein